MSACWAGRYFLINVGESAQMIYMLYSRALAWGVGYDFYN